MSCATPILLSGPLGHVPETAGHVAEIAGHDPETAGHLHPKYAVTYETMRFWCGGRPVGLLKRFQRLTNSGV